MTTQKTAILRVCASHEWIFKKKKKKTPDNGCPKRGFAHYRTRFCYGDKAYYYYKNQKPWIDKS